jgi:hypothetical protein
MFKKIALPIAALSLISCGSDHKKSDGSSPYPSEGSPSEIVDQNNGTHITVYFAPYTSILLLEERLKLWGAFKDLKEEEGYWEIVGYTDTFDCEKTNEKLSMKRARSIEHYLRHNFNYVVVGIVQGKSDIAGQAHDRVEVTFKKYLPGEKKYEKNCYQQSGC